MRKLFTFFIISCTLTISASKISDAYSALSIFDYFKAKQLFYKSLSKSPCQSAYGLATIYFRTDNPFSNIDSAAKYISISQMHFKDSVSYFSFHINKLTITLLSHKIIERGFDLYCKKNSINDLQHYLSQFYFSEESILSRVYFIRDSLLLNHTVKYKSSDSVNEFLLRYPETLLFKEGKTLFHNFQYNEKVPSQSIQELQLFIKQFPSNPNTIDAEIKLYHLTQQLQSADSIYLFIKKYSSNLTKQEAWKLLYSLSVKNYTEVELITFLNNYPDYPNSQAITKEIELSKIQLIPLKTTHQKYGFIDTTGNWVIQPQFDDASNFIEGFAAVCKNDSCFYINKEGIKTSNYIFDEIENYKNGIAIVKKDNVYYLINRAGQFISDGYEDISEPYFNIYVCKQNNLYGAINLKGEIIIPFTYHKLGNFKNKYAYYLLNEYGLVNINNKTISAQWDWISDVDSCLITIVKKKNQFGLINVNEQIILPCEFDYITPCKDGIYLIVKNNQYGFFNAIDKCFITAIEYNYNPSFEPEYFTNGKYFKLIKNNEVALVDANGRYSINFGLYSNLFFAKCDVIRIQKNNKYGYVDRKLKPITPVEFEKATDFINNLAIVTKTATSFIIDKNGKSIYSIKNGEIVNTDYNLFLVTQNNLIGLLNDQGKMLLNIEFEEIKLISNQLFACIKNDEIYLFNLKTKVLKKI